MMALTFKKISVIGLGLIGTSILHAIKEKADKQIITCPRLHVGPEAFLRTQKITISFKSLIVDYGNHMHSHF